MDLYNASNGSEEEEELLTLEEYEERKGYLNDIIDMGQSALRLAENPDFMKLIMQGYFTDEPQRLAELMASGRINSKTMDDCAKELDAIGKFRSYMKRFTEQHHLAVDELKSLELAREESILREAGEIK